MVILNSPPPGVGQFSILNSQVIENKNTMSRFIFLIACLLTSEAHSQVVLFPGDANKDGVANHYDLLPIGVAFGTEGFPRPGANQQWQPQFQPNPWLDILPVSHINLAFMDSDGNGFIDEGDIDAIALNFDSTQNASQPPPSPYLLADSCFICWKPELLISFDRETAMVKDTFYAILTLRYPLNLPPFAGALGIAFDLTYDPLNVKDRLTKVFPDTMPGDLMFVTATSSLARPWRAVPPGKIGFGATGKGSNALWMARQLGVVAFVVEDIIIRAGVAADFWLDASKILLINQNEQVVGLETVMVDTLVLFDPVNSTQEKDWQKNIHLTPNPATNWVEISATGTVLKGVEVYNEVGKLMQAVTAKREQTLRLSLAGWPPGICFLKINTDKGAAFKKLAKHK